MSKKYKFNENIEVTKAADTLQQDINSKAAAADLTTHTTNTDIHITAAERAAWNSKSESNAVSKDGDTMTGNLLLSSCVDDGGPGASMSPTVTVKGGLGTKLEMYDDSLNGATINKYGVGALNITADEDITINGILVPHVDPIIDESGEKIPQTFAVQSDVDFIAQENLARRGEILSIRGDVATLQDEATDVKYHLNNLTRADIENIV